VQRRGAAIEDTAIEDTAIAKKGKRSVGVAAQYASALGKAANVKPPIARRWCR
jgi:SRSO17 transposase